MGGEEGESGRKDEVEETEGEVEERSEGADEV